LSFIIDTQIGWILGYARRHEEAITHYRSVLSRHPDYVWALANLAGELRLSGQSGEAIEYMERAVRLTDRNPAMIGFLGLLYGAAGRIGDAHTRCWKNCSRHRSAGTFPRMRSCTYI
jgi:tetratricopeptide (TPR) repeat protein